ncbi:MAG: flagellar protein FlaG [Clostridiales bacterium]|nr:flagellar protein FlaG [Clostridiales bacterium]
MALEVVKTSIYQSNLGPAAKPTDASGSKSVDVNVKLETLRKESTSAIQPITGQDDDKESSAASQQYIKSEISKANNRLKSHNTKCEFGYHEETRRVTIKVMDKDTEEVIREIPPEETLKMIEKLWELAGLMIDERR